MPSRFISILGSLEIRFTSWRKRDYPANDVSDLATNSLGGIVEDAHDDAQSLDGSDGDAK